MLSSHRRTSSRIDKPGGSQLLLVEETLEKSLALEICFSFSALQVQSREAVPRLMAPDPPPARDVRQQEPENHGCDTLSN